MTSKSPSEEDFSEGTDDQARRILESITDAFLSVDKDWRFTYANAQALRVLDRKRGDLVGEVLWDLFPGLRDSEFEAVYRRVAERRTAESTTAFYPDHNRWYEVHVYPAPGGISIYFRNVTDRKNAEEALRKSEEKYRTLFDSIDEGFCVLQMMFDHDNAPVDYRFIEYNPAFERHTGLKDALGQTARTLVPDLDESWFRNYGQVALTGEPARFVSHAPAMGRWFDVFAFRVGPPEERTVALIFNDITERKEAEKALQRQNSQLQTLYSLSDAVQRATGIEEMCELAMDGLLAATGARRASVLLFDADGVMRFKAWRGLSDEYRAAVQGHTPWTPSDVDAQPITVEDVRMDDELKSYQQVFQKEAIRALGFIPLVDSGRVLGKFMVYYGEPHRFSDDELAVCRAVAASVAFSINRARAEEALRRERDLVRTIAENSTSALAMMDVAGNCTYANKALLDMTGYSAEEITREPLHYIIHHHHPDGRPYPLEECPIDRALRENVDIRGHEDLFFRKDGSSFPVLCAASPIYANGQPVSTVFEIRDLTAEKAAEAALQDSEKRFRSTFENAAVGIAHVGIDGHWLRVNQRLCEIVGYSRDELLQMTFQDITHPDDLDADAKHGRRILEGEITSYQLEKRYIRKTGEPIWINLTVSLVRGEQGQPDYFISVIEDITERKVAAEALQRSEKRFRNMADTAPAKLWITDGNNACTFLSRRWFEFTGQDEQDGLGYGWLDAVHEEDREATLEKFLAAVKSRQAFSIDFRLRRRDGEYRWVLDEGRPRYGENGEWRGYIGSVVDVHDRKLTEAALRKTEQHLRELSKSLEERVAERTAELHEQTLRLRGLASELTSTEQRERKRLAAMLHDDLQQLLVAAKIHLLESRRHLDNDVAIALVDEAAKRLSEAVGAARDLTRQLRPPTLYEAGLASALEWLASEMLERHRLVVAVENGKDAPRLIDDVNALLFDCVRELLFNIVKYAGVDSAWVALRREKDVLRLVVQDNGRGFDVEAISHDGDPGGFGLFSVRERLAALGGSMTIESGLGEGTRIELAVPIASAIADEGKDQPVPPLMPVSGQEGARGVVSTDANRIRLVVVDDHAMVREGVANILGSDHRMAVVGEAADGIEALGVLEQHQPDVVLLDLNMPRMNGVDAAREIRRRWPDMLIVGLSVQGDNATAKSMLEAGAAAFIPKSGDSELMISTIVGVAHRQEHTKSEASAYQA